MFLNSETLYYITDYSNEGILYIHSNVVVCNYLKRGLLDCEVRRCGRNSNGYQELFSLYKMKGNFDKYLSRTTGHIENLSSISINPTYLERKRLISIRKHLVIHLLMMTEVATKSTQICPFGSIESTLEFAIRDSDPENGVWSDGIQEYAQIVNVGPEVAYREVKLQLDNIQCVKMRTYAFMKMFADEINKITTNKEAEKMKTTIADKFLRDTWI